jgi:Large extracellular alpha-helical protein
MNVRDDRLEVFGELAAGESRAVVYVARAVTHGSFQAPEVKTEAMYDPDVWAREPEREIEILGPWADFLL